MNYDLQEEGTAYVLKKGIHGKENILGPTRKEGAGTGWEKAVKLGESDGVFWAPNKRKHGFN